jgi:hypothetical protein
VEDWKKVLRTQPTVYVPFAGKCLADLGKNAAYEAAKRGDIEIVQVSGKKRVTTSWLRQKLGIEGD